MKFFILIIFITQTIFSMNLTSSEANKAMRYLRGAKGVLIYKNNQFKYIPVNSISKEKGYIKSFGYGNYSPELHKDDYHININNTPMDLTKIYYRVGNSNKWVSIGSKIHHFGYRKNSTVYVYKKDEKIPQNMKRRIMKNKIEKKKLKVANSMNEVAETEIIKSTDGGGIELRKTPEDKKMDNATVLLDKHKYIE